jgi:hypothetical protein
MKDVHLSVYGNPAQRLRMVEVSEPNAPSASEALARIIREDIASAQSLVRSGL